MLTKHRISETLIKGVGRVEKDVTNRYTERSVNEDLLNGYLTFSLANKLEKAARSNEFIDFTAVPYKKHEEKKTGADIGFRFQLSTDDYLAESGLLVQAKRDDYYDTQLPLQCFKMLSRTDESYIFQYTSEGIHAFAARPVYYEGGTGGKFNNFYGLPFTGFFRNFFEGFLGEPLIARNLDQPSDVDPLGAAVKYLLDVRISVGETLDDEIFRYVTEEYGRLQGYDFPNFDI